MSNADGSENLDDLIAAAEGRQSDSPLEDEGESSAASTPEIEQLESSEAQPAESPKPVAKKSGPKKPVVVPQSDDEPGMNWYILKVAFNREDSIRDALEKRVKMEGMEEYFGDIVVPTEDVVEFTRAGKRRIVKRKLLPGYLMVNMIINDDTWFLVRETGGISDFTGAAGKPMPMDPADIDRFIKKPELGDDEEVQLKTSIPFKVGDRVRVKEGNFQNQEGEIDGVDEANGRITVIINIFGRSVPMELDHWQVEDL